MSTPVYPENKMKRKLRKGETVHGMMCSSGNPAMIEIMGYTGAGLDYVVLETEHSPIDMEGPMAVDLIRAAELAGLTPLMRVRDNDPSLIHKALDLGCQGIFVVHINSKEDAQKVVDAVKYPPLGKRASSALGRDLGRYRYARSAREYVDHWNKESTVMFLLESKEGVENMDDIVTVPGIDVIGIGQGDLSLDLGRWGPRFTDPECIKAVEKLLTIATPRGIAVRDVFSDLDTALKWHAKGIRVFEWGLDLSVFQTAVKGIVSKAESVRNARMK